MVAYRGQGMVLRRNHAEQRPSSRFLTMDYIGHILAQSITNHAKRVSIKRNVEADILNLVRYLIALLLFLNS